MSNRRKCSPRDTARRDQAGAFARNRAGAGDTVIVRDYAQPGTRCCWCDCPDPLTDPASPHRNPGYVCADLCQVDAEHIITVGYGGPAATGYPACERHVDDLESSILRLMASLQAKLTFAGLDSFG